MRFESSTASDDTRRRLIVNWPLVDCNAIKCTTFPFRVSPTCAAVAGRIANVRYSLRQFTLHRLGLSTLFQFGKARLLTSKNSGD